MKPIRPNMPRATLAVRFKAEIEEAASQGVSLDDLTMYLTLGDAEQLKRDRTVPLADIRFADGIMTYLGVKVVAVKAAKGEIVISGLRPTDEEVVAPPAPPAKVKKPRAPSKAKVAAEAKVVEEAKA